jgi:hypothetical protein
MMLSFKYLSLLCDYGFLGFRCGMMFSWPRHVTKYDLEADCFSSPYDDVNKRKLAYSHLGIGNKYAKVSQ